MSSWAASIRSCCAGAGGGVGGVCAHKRGAVDAGRSGDQRRRAEPGDDGHRASGGAAIRHAAPDSGQCRRERGAGGRRWGPHIRCRPLHTIRNVGRPSSRLPAAEAPPSVPSPESRDPEPVTLRPRREPGRERPRLRAGRAPRRRRCAPAPAGSARAAAGTGRAAKNARISAPFAAVQNPPSDMTTYGTDWNSPRRPTVVSHCDDSARPRLVLGARIEQLPQQRRRILGSHFRRKREGQGARGQVRRPEAGKRVEQPVVLLRRVRAPPWPRPDSGRRARRRHRRRRPAAPARRTSAAATRDRRGSPRPGRAPASAARCRRRSAPAAATARRAASARRRSRRAAVLRRWRRGPGGTSRRSQAAKASRSAGSAMAPCT